MKKISRRNFLLASGAVTIGAALAACGGGSFLSSPSFVSPLFSPQHRFFCSGFLCCFRCSRSTGQGAEHLVLE